MTRRRSGRRHFKTCKEPSLTAIERARAMAGWSAWTLAAVVSGAGLAIPLGLATLAALPAAAQAGDSGGDATQSDSPRAGSSDRGSDATQSEGPPTSTPDDEADPDARSTIRFGESEYELKSFSVSEGETIVGDRYFFGDGSEIDGVLDGDLFAFSGSDNNINGTVTGDVHLLGEALSVSGEVSDDVRALASRIDVKGRIGGDLLALAKEVRVPKGGRIDGQTCVAGATVTLLGTFGHTVKAAAGQVVFGGVAERDVKIESDLLKFEPGARIEGNLEYTSREEIAGLREGGELRSIIAGDVTFVPKAPKSKKDGGQSIHWIWETWTFLTSLILGFGIILIARRPVMAIIESARTDALRSLGFGLIGHVFVPFAGVILIVLCLTLPAGVLVLVAWGSLFYLAKLAVSAAIGDVTLRKLGRTPSPYLSLFLGMVALWILFMIPWIGDFLYWFLVPMFGIGAIVIGLHEWTRRNGREEGPMSIPSTAPGSHPSLAPSAGGD